MPHGKTWWAQLFLGASLSLALVTIFLSTDELAWDETYHIYLSRKLFETGLTTSFLRNMNVAMGPFYAMVLSVFYYFVGDHPSLQLIRMLNCFFLGGILFFLAKTFERPGRSAWDFALASLSVPLLLLMSLFAMSDIPALFFFSMSLFCLKKSFELVDSPARALSISAFSGLMMGLCLLTRQTYLVGLSGLMWGCFKIPSARKKALIYLLFALPLPATLFYIWGGTTPPILAAVENQRGHFSSTHFFLAVSQSALLFYFCFPELLFRQKKTLLASVACFLFSTPLIEKYLVSGLSERLPVRFVFQNLLGSWHPVVAKYLLVISFALGFYFLINKVCDGLKSTDRVQQSLILSGISLIVYPIVVASNYSSRYPMAGILLIILLEEQSRNMSSGWSKVRTVITSAIGLGVGAFYLRVWS